VGAEVIGISGDSPEKIKDFKQKHRLPFILLSDKNNMLRKQLALPSTLGIIPGRITFILNELGVLKHIFNSQLQFEKHITESLKYL
jgi:peroxiredoxin Q/BCP